MANGPATYCRKGISLIEIVEILSDNETATAWFEKQPWGTVGKTAVAGSKDRATGQMSAAVIERTDAATLHGFVADRVADSTMVITNEHHGYRGIPHPSRTVKYSVSEYVDGMANTSGIESFWAALKRGYHGTFHHISAKPLQCYIAEFATRHNLRLLAIASFMSETCRPHGRQMAHLRSTDRRSCACYRCV